ncbi:MAG: YiiX/YebB-like N1pC/P60 family cysteine hydrolase [Bacteroidota bacterium]|nr:YiiX/YebB-like N1pC/P60 family cysteine hydrolase [Bacteroidota bacterium]
MKKISGTILLLIIAITTSVAQNLSEKPFELRNGDLLFQDLDCGPMCDAIEEVTQGYRGAKFSHVGMVLVQNDTVKVIEAISRGVSITPLPSFLQRSLDKDGKPKVAVGRLKSRYQKLINRAITEALKLRGKPYDDYFLINNDAYYCSELVYFAFMRANGNKSIFPLAPMTYKSPKSKTLFPVWDEYFKKLGVPVPEGKPGINPGGISRSPYLNVFFPFGKQDRK